jgi:hypothetical protein
VKNVRTCVGAYVGAYVGTKQKQPPQWIEASIQFFADRGFRLGVDEPYSGSLVPMKYYKNDPSTVIGAIFNESFADSLICLKINEV